MKRHPADPVSLVFGLIFLSVVGWLMAERFLNLSVDLPHLGWFAALALILFGVAGIVASFRRRSPS